MSSQISTAFITQFEAEVKQAYQGMAKLGGTSRTRNNVVGSTVRFPKMGKGLAQPRVPQTDVTPMNVSHSNVTLTLGDWIASEYTDIFDQQKVNFDERKELVQVVSGAMGRRLDQIQLDALAAGVTSTITTNHGGSDAFNLAKIRRMKKLMDAQGVGSGERHWAVSAAAMEQLLGATAATSADFQTVKALVDGNINTMCGFRFHMIEDRDEGGLTLAGNIRTLLAWHKDSIGVGIGMNISTEINYIPEKTSWLTTGKLSAGSVAIDALGIYASTIDESVVI